MKEIYRVCLTINGEYDNNKYGVKYFEFVDDAIKYFNKIRKMVVKDYESLNTNLAEDVWREIDGAYNFLLGNKSIDLECIILEKSG